jgi:peroxiredoxin family protein
MTKTRKIGLIINTGSYERVAYALSFASICAATGMEVHVLFSYGAIPRLVKGNTDFLGDETPEWIRDTLKKGLERGHIQKISDLIRDFMRFGGKIYACVGAMALHNVVKDDLLDGVKVASITSFLESVEDANFLLYV